MADDLERYSRAAVAGRLKEARTAKFASAAELARAVGMKEVTVRAHENGQNGVSTGNAKRYAKALGITAEWLLYGRDTPEKFGFLNVDKMDREMQELAVATLHRRIPIWQDAKEEGFQRVPLRKNHLATGFLSMMVTGYESLSPHAFKMADDHAAAHYPPGRYVIAAHPAKLDLRDGDHVVVARTLPRSVLTETTVRAVRLSGGRIGLTSLRVGADPAVPIAFVTATIASDGGALDAGQLGRPLIANATQFAADVVDSLIDPDAALVRLEAEGAALTEEIRRLEDQAKKRKENPDDLDRRALEVAQQMVEMNARQQQLELVRTDALYINTAEDVAVEIIGIVLADYSQRERSGRTIANWDRRQGALEPVDG